MGRDNRPHCCGSARCRPRRARGRRERCRIRGGRAAAYGFAGPVQRWLGADPSEGQTHLAARSRASASGAVAGVVPARGAPRRIDKAARDRGVGRGTAPRLAEPTRAQARAQAPHRKARAAIVRRARSPRDPATHDGVRAGVVRALVAGDRSATPPQSRPTVNQRQHPTRRRPIIGRRTRAHPEQRPGGTQWRRSSLK